MKSEQRQEPEQILVDNAAMAEDISLIHAEVQDDERKEMNAQAAQQKTEQFAAQYSSQADDPNTEIHSSEIDPD